MAVVDEDPLAFWLGLASVPGLGSAGQRALLKAFGSPRAVFDADLAALRQVVGERIANALQALDPQTVAAPGIAWLKADSTRHLLPLDHPAYPPILLESPDLGELELERSSEPPREGEL